MLMPGRTGIDLGRQIRMSGYESVIIYITSSDDHALDAYGLESQNYLVEQSEQNLKILRHDFTSLMRTASSYPLPSLNMSISIWESTTRHSLFLTS